jgi:NAD(P)-dependent dehydrogenase (short-subunit alcohol dehydrogenase family)
MSNAGTLAGRRALVTGGASGIGAAIARRFAAEGAHVTVADVNVQWGTDLAEELGGDFTRLDVTEPEAWDRVVSGHEHFDIGILNAGVTTHPAAIESSFDGHDPLTSVPLAELTDADYRRIMGVNIDGVVFGVRALAPLMARHHRGDLVVTASLAGLSPIPPDPIYGLTKHAVVGLVRSLAPGLALHGISICSLNPGFVDTPILGDLARDRLVDLGVPMLHPSDLGDAALHAVTHRRDGAQWVVWPGLPTQAYEWAPPINFSSPS